MSKTMKRKVREQEKQSSWNGQVHSMKEPIADTFALIGYMRMLHRWPAEQLKRPMTFADIARMFPINLPDGKEADGAYLEAWFKKKQERMSRSRN